MVKWRIYEFVIFLKLVFCRFTVHYFTALLLTTSLLTIFPAMLKQIFTFGLLTASLALHAQHSAGINFMVQTPYDTFRLDEVVRLTYKIEEADVAQFSPPDFGEDWEQAAGVSTNTSMNMVNGKVTRSTSYTYQIRPNRLGRLELPRVKIKTQMGELESPAKSVVIMGEKYQRAGEPDRLSQQNNQPNNPFGDFGNMGGFGDLNGLFSMPEMNMFGFGDIQKQFDQLNQQMQSFGNFGDMFQQFNQLFAQPFGGEMNPFVQPQNPNKPNTQPGNKQPQKEKEPAFKL